MDVYDVKKIGAIKPNPRNRHPDKGWEKALEVQALLADKDGNQKNVAMKLPTFLMNPAWAEHPFIQWIRKEWVADTANHHDFEGSIKFPLPLPPAPAPAPESPGSPWGGCRKRDFPAMQDQSDSESDSDGDWGRKKAQLQNDIRSERASKQARFAGEPPLAPQAEAEVSMLSRESTVRIEEVDA